MSAGIWFWIIYVICAVLGGYFALRPEADRYGRFGWSIILLILLGLLGWGIFGPPIK
jgi:hypothetical protein